MNAKIKENTERFFTKINGNGEIQSETELKEKFSGVSFSEFLDNYYHELRTDEDGLFILTTPSQPRGWEFAK